MSRVLRISLVVAAAFAAVLTFVVLRPDDVVNTAAESPPEATVTRDPASDADAEPTPTPTPRPQPPLLTADATRTLTFERGDTIAFRVRHSSPDEIHVHGYDVSRQLPAGRTVTVRFPADIEGIFEVELEHSATPLGRLRVEP